MKIKASVSFVDEKGILRQAGDVVEVSKEFLEKQNRLCLRFNLSLHEIIKSAAPEGNTPEGNDSNAPEGNGGKKATAKPTKDDL